jgi:hypothetical protein
MLKVRFLPESRMRENLHVRFDEGRGAVKHPLLLYRLAFGSSLGEIEARRVVLRN